MTRQRNHSDQGPLDEGGAHPYTTLTPDVVIAAVEALGHRCDGRVLALNSYENRVYQVGRDGTTPVVVKFYRPGRWDRETILDEQELSGLRIAASEAVAEAVEMRREESERLFHQIESELAKVVAFADWFEPQMADFRQRLLDRVRGRVESLVGPEVQVDPERVLQEAAVLADRADVAEEVVRLRAHLENFSDRLATGGVVGRSLDFLSHNLGS